VHIDAINAKDEVASLVENLANDKVISLGVIDGRNIWKSNLTSILDWLAPIAKVLGNRLWLAPSCSLLHVPVDLASETELDSEITNWLAFATQKLQELSLLDRAINHGRARVEVELSDNANAIEQRRLSTRVNNPVV